MENLVLHQRQNSTLGSCVEPFNTIYLVLNSILLSFGFPTTVIVIVKLLIGLFKTGSFLPAEVFLLQINITNVCLFIAYSLVFLDGQFSMTLFLFLYVPSSTARPVFLLAICVIFYLAIVHPVSYMTAKTLRHWEWLVTTLGWLYALVTDALIIIYDVDIFRPVFMVAFHITILPSLFFSIAKLRALSSSGSGNFSPAKKKAFLIVLSSMVALLLYFIPRVYVLVYSYIAPMDYKRFQCSEGPVIMMLPKFSEFAMPVIFLYSLRKLGV